MVAIGTLVEGDAPSYFIECMLYNVPDHLLSLRLAAIYGAIVEWLSARQLQGFATQSGTMKLFGPRPEQWSTEQARGFVSALQQLWQEWR